MSNQSNTVNHNSTLKGAQAFVEVCFAILIGILFVYLVGTILDIIFPMSNKYLPNGDYSKNFYDKSFYGSLVALSIGVAVILGSIFIPKKFRVLDFGALASGGFTIIYSLFNFNDYGSDHKIGRLLFVLLVLILICVIGYLKFYKYGPDYPTYKKNMNFSGLKESESSFVHTSGKTSNSATVEEAIEKASSQLLDDEEDSLKTSNLEERITVLEEKLSFLKKNL